MVKPTLQQAYRSSHATDIRRTFELERRRLAVNDADHQAVQFGTALGLALLSLTEGRPAALSRPEQQP